MSEIQVLYGKDGLVFLDLRSGQCPCVIWEQHLFCGGLHTLGYKIEENRVDAENTITYCILLLLLSIIIIIYFVIYFHSIAFSYKLTYSITGSMKSVSTAPSQREESVSV